MSLSAGTRLGDWVIEKPLGAGGMGSVYRCHSVLAKDVLAAVKVLKASNLGDFEKRFVQEMRTLSALKHPNIVAVHGGGRCEERDLMYMAMEFVEGEDLEHRLKRGPLSIDEGLKIFGAVSNALAYAHQNNIAHRDIKPANIMLRPDGIPIIVDFGIAVSAGQTRMTMDGGIPGTVAYMPPEVFAGGECEPRSSDAYALGVVMWEMFSGKDPFAPPTTTGASQQFAQVMAMKLRSEALELNIQAPDKLKEVVRRITEPEPEERLADLAEVSTLLEAAGAPRGPALPGWSRSQPIQAPPPSNGYLKTGLTSIFSAGCATLGIVTIITAIVGLLWMNGAFIPKKRPPVDLEATLIEVTRAVELKQYARALQLAGYAVDDHHGDPSANFAYGMALTRAKKGTLARPYLCAAKNEGLNVQLEALDCKRGVGAEAPLTPAILLAQLSAEDISAVMEGVESGGSDGSGGFGLPSFRPKSSPPDIEDKAAPLSRPKSKKALPTAMPSEEAAEMPSEPSVADADEEVAEMPSEPSVADAKEAEELDDVAVPGHGVGEVIEAEPEPLPHRRFRGDTSGGASKKGAPTKKASKKSRTTSSAGSGSVRIRSLRVTGVHSESAVRAILYRWLRRVRYCYDSALKRNPSLEGRLTLEWTIDASGRVQDVSYVRPLTMDNQMRQCVQRDAKRLRFATASDESDVQISLQISTN